jgi:serine/threonine protein kinase
VLALLGQGGMGEVYQAHDTKLGRDVAIKVLPEAFAHDPERLSRFQHEAKMLASLNHPNIATIHGLEESNGMHYLVMELVPGETLRVTVKEFALIRVELDCRHHFVNGFMGGAGGANANIATREHENFGAFFNPGKLMGAPVR